MSQRSRRLSESLLEKAVGADYEKEHFTPEACAPEDDCIIIHEGPAPASTIVCSPQGNPVPSPKPNCPVSPVATSSAPPPPKDINWTTPSLPRDSKAGLRVGERAIDVDDDNLSVFSIMTATTNRRAPSVLSMYGSTADVLRRQTLLGNEAPNIHTLQLFCKKCPAHGEQPTAAEGRKHLRTQHWQCVCPYCFDKLPSYGNDYKQHLKKHFVKKGSRLEEIACRYCDENYHYEDLWNHIDQVHFVLNGEDTQPMQPSQSNRQKKSLPNLGRGDERTTESRQQPISAGSTAEKARKHLKDHRATASTNRHDLPSVGRHVFPAISRETATAVLQSVSQPSSSSKRMKSKSIEEFAFTRRYFTSGEKNKLVKEFISNPNQPWIEHSKRLATEFNVPMTKVQMWFCNARRNFVQEQPPSWARTADFRYVWNVNKKNGKLRFTRS